MSDSSSPRAPPVVDSIYCSLPLHVAAVRGEKDKLEKLVSKKNIDTACTEDGATALHLAARFGNAKCVRLLLKKKAKILKDKFGNTALHSAAFYNHRRSAELLLDIGAKINETNLEGWTPLHCAIKAGFPAMVKLLLDRGANADAIVEGKPRLHPLHIAATYKLTEIARLLVGKCKDKNPVDEQGRTPMHIASANGSAEIVGALVMHGADVNATDNQGFVPLQLAIDGDYEDICHTLTTNGADVSLRYAANKPAKVTDDDLDAIGRADRYGHIASNHSPRLGFSDEITPDLAKDVDTAGDSKIGIKKLKKEMSRAKKWSNMIKNWDKYTQKKAEKVASRVAKGIPDCVRGEAWKLLTTAPPQMQANKHKYTDLLTRKSKWVTQIDLDVNRSSRNHLQFKERYGKGQVALFSVLKVYSLYDDEVGYCQGMSDITSLLLKYVTEQEAFWMLERLMYAPKWNMRELFLPGFPRLQSSFLLHDMLLKEYAPALAAHLAKENVLAAFYATKWYLMAFLDIFPFDVTLRLWDLLMVEGYEIVFSIAINVLLMFQDQMLGKSFDRIMAFLRTLETKTDIDTDKFIGHIVKNKIPLKKIRRMEAKLSK